MSRIEQFEKAVHQARLDAQRKEEEALAREPKLMAKNDVAIARLQPFRQALEVLQNVGFVRMQEVDARQDADYLDRIKTCARNFEVNGFRGTTWEEYASEGQRHIYEIGTDRGESMHVNMNGQGQNSWPAYMIEKVMKRLVEENIDDPVAMSKLREAEAAIDVLFPPPAPVVAKPKPGWVDRIKLRFS